MTPEQVEKHLNTLQGAMLLGGHRAAIRDLVAAIGSLRAERDAEKYRADRAEARLAGLVGAAEAYLLDMLTRGGGVSTMGVVDQEIADRFSLALADCGASDEVR